LATDKLVQILIERIGAEAGKQAKAINKKTLNEFDLRAAARVVLNREFN